MAGRIMSTPGFLSQNPKARAVPARIAPGIGRGWKAKAHRPSSMDRVMPLSSSASRLRLSQGALAASRKTARLVRPIPPGQSVDNDHASQSHQGRRQARGEFAETEEEKTGCGHPVIEGGLIEVRLAEFVDGLDHP
jgi:hypothetical protein